MGILSSIIANVEAFFRPEMTPQQKAEALDRMAASAGERLDWRHSVVDLMKLTQQESDFDARKKLAGELSWAKEAYTGTAAQNDWLHQQVMDRLKLGG